MEKTKNDRLMVVVGLTEKSNKCIACSARVLCMVHSIALIEGWIKRGGGAVCYCLVLEDVAVIHAGGWLDKQTSSAGGWIGEPASSTGGDRGRCSGHTEPR